MPGRQRLAVAGDEVRLLVTFQADAVARPVEEVGAVARGLDDPARPRRRSRSQGTPGRTAPVAASCAPWSTRTGAGTPASGPFAGSPPVTQTVRVMSLPYPPSVPPMSISTIGSPAAITRSPGSWCGDALLGPEATIQNSAWS